MAHPILMPKPGQMTEECVLVAWHKREGDKVEKGDVLFEIETDKSNMDVEAFENGVLLKRVVEEGQTVPVNTVCGYVGEPGEAVPDAPAPIRRSRQPVAPRPRRRRPRPPCASRGTGQAGAVAATAAAPPRPRRRPPAHQSAGQPARRRLRHRPAHHRRHRAGGPHHRARRPGRPGGRLGGAGRRRRRPLAPAGRFRVPRPRPHAPDSEDAAPRQMSRMRRVIAERLTLSATTVPQFTVTVAVDVTRLLALRNELKAAGTALTITDFIVSATAQTLVEFPDVNSRTDGVSVWPRRRVHVGLAVSLPDGLVVPVIRDADRRSLDELHARAAALAEAARNGALTPDDMTGSTFTISNLGMFGVDEFSAIINPGESAILAVSSVVPTPVAVGDGIRHPADNEADPDGRPSARRRRARRPVPERAAPQAPGCRRVPRRRTERLRASRRLEAP